MRLPSILLAGTILLAAATPARADVVCEWMDFAAKIGAASTPPPDAPRTGEHDRAGVQVPLAMFEALNAIDRRYESYLGMAPGDRTASPDVAAAAAAYHVLLAHFPGQKAALDDSLNIALLGAADPVARDKGKAIGEAAAKLALASGGFDPALKPVPFRPRTSPGV